MSHDKSNANVPKTKQLTAPEVYQLTSTVLQEHFQLDMSGRNFEASDIWDVLVAASVQRLTIEAACDLLENAPSPNTVRNAIRDILADDDTLAQLEDLVNQMLVARLPKSLPKRARPCAADMTDIPYYHGKHEDDDDRVRRGRAKQGTTHFHSYGTLCIIKGNKRYTLGITLFWRSDSVIVCKYNKGRYHRNGVKHFAYTIIGDLKRTPQQLFEEYRRRFGVETGYRLMNTTRARTTTKCVALRLFFVALALLLLNLWHYVKWHHLFVPKPGPRQVLHHLLPLARWRLWL